MITYINNDINDNFNLNIDNLGSQLHPLINLTFNNRSFRDISLIFRVKLNIFIIMFKFLRK